MLHIFILFFTMLSSIATAEAAEPFSIAFYYATKPPLNELKAFDIVVVDPSSIAISPDSYTSSSGHLFAYLSVGEADPSRTWYSEILPEWFIAYNQTWNRKVIDLSNPECRDFFLNKIVESLWTAGYRGFFLDTLDSYRMVKDKSRYSELEAGLIETIRKIKKRHPEARLIFNRGFEVLEQLKDVVFAVAAESLFQSFDPLTGVYTEVTEGDREWLLGKFSEIRKSGLPVISIEYVDPTKRDLARKTAAKIKGLGYIPWVTDKDLGTLGVGSIEVLPRTILGLYNGSEGSDPIYTNLHRFAVMPLNYLGYQVELHDMTLPLPAGILAGRYAGVVVWANSDQSDKQNELFRWVKRQIAQGVPVAFLSRFGFPPSLAGELPGLEYQTINTKPSQLKLLHHNPAITWQSKPKLVTAQFVPLKIVVGESEIAIGSPDGRILSDVVGITPWGGYALEPFVIMQAIGDMDGHWVLDPFEFFPRALKLKNMPAPDTTTENGVRLLLVHIDADGFESKAEWRGGRYAAAELRENILQKYRVPTSFSIITSTLGDHGLYPETASLLQAEARAIFALPWIEAASHSFSHPFYWQNSEFARKEHEVRHLPIPGYTFNLEDEITGSIRFIEQKLLPPGKRVALFQWTGDCTPGSDALAAVGKLGVGNINGGFTAVTESNRGLALIGPLGIEKGGHFQVFAPNQNENVYTNHWSAPFYAYRRMIETFRLTDAPRRLKPINIYYHVFSMTKIASWKALDDVYTWVLAQKPYPIYPSDYVKKVQDFNRTVIARSGDSWLIRNSGELRELRIPLSSGYPDLTASRSVIGFSDYNDQRYIHIAPGGSAELKLTDTPPVRPWVAAASVRINSFDWTPTALRLSATANSTGSIRFANAAGCRLISSRGSISAQKDGKEQLFLLESGEHKLELVCK